MDLYKIGRANYLGKITNNTNWKDYTHRIVAMCQELGARHYIKKDLQKYLPAGYANEMRVRQHH